MNSIELQNACFEEDFHYLEILIFRGSRKFRTTREEWVDNKAVWERDITFPCTLFKGKNDRFKEKLYTISAVAYPKEKTVATFQLDAAEFAGKQGEQVMVIEPSKKCEDDQAQLKLTLSLNSLYTAGPGGATGGDVEDDEGMSFVSEEGTVILQLSSGLQVPVPGDQALSHGWKQVEVVLRRTIPESLGLGLEHTGISPHDYILVESLVPGRPAATCQPQIKLGDVLYSANGTLIAGKSFDDVQQIMSTDEVYITFLEPPTHLLRNAQSSNNYFPAGNSSNSTGYANGAALTTSGGGGSVDGSDEEDAYIRSSSQRGGSREQQLRGGQRPDPNAKLTEEEQYAENVRNCQKQLHGCEHALGSCPTNVRSALLLSFRTCNQAMRLLEGAAAKRAGLEKQLGRMSGEGRRNQEDLTRAHEEMRELEEMVEQLQQSNRRIESKSENRQRDLEQALAKAKEGGGGGAAFDAEGGNDASNDASQDQERMLLRVRVGELEGRLEAVRDEKKLVDSRLRSLLKVLCTIPSLITLYSLLKV
jgi:hypothetical protein